MYPANVNAKPFLKWAGGKRDLIPAIEQFLPQEINTYYEPFLGGAAVYWHLANQQRFEKAVLNDLNADGITCYQVIQKQPQELIQELKTYPFDKEFFTKLRALDTSGLTLVQRAARMMYLNRTCFNGLYRVNKKGQFNVPWGKYKNPKILDVENVLACHRALQNASLFCGSYAKVIPEAVPGDVVYFDPPYVPLNATSNFRSYTSEGFTLDDQKELAQRFAELASRGVTVIASNADTPLVRELYPFETHVVPCRRNINSKGDKRGPVNELIILGRPA